MVKVSAPAMSLDASGSLAGTLVFSKWKGRNYVRQLVRPSNPKSALQVATRAMFKFLSQAWATVAATPQGTWLEAATADIVSPFNSYMKENQMLWRGFEAPAQTNPRPITGTLPVAALTSATGGSRHTDLLITTTTLNNVWGAMIFRSATGTFTPSFANCIAVIPITATGEKTYTDSEMPIGTNYYDVKFFTKEGVLGPDEGEVSATCTA
ncbi:MAG: hypothetical protein ACOYB0_10595 [Polynucleobacter sp.]